MDIGTAVDLTNESEAKLAKTKLRGLTHALVTEAINSDKILRRNKGFTMAQTVQC